jgi:hypothetical protein
VELLVLQARGLGFTPTIKDVTVDRADECRGRVFNLLKKLAGKQDKYTYGDSDVEVISPPQKVSVCIA